MLRVVVPITEAYDEVTEEFVTLPKVELQLEHSLVSLSKWESRWKKPFLSKVEKTMEETLDYIYCMTITQNISSDVYERLSKDIVDRIQAYIEDSMTATVITKHQSGGSREIVTAEIIYYWMVAYNIPFECQKWHLNRLLTLVDVCSIKNTPSKKMSRREILSRNASLNAARRQTLGTKG